MNKIKFGSFESEQRVNKYFSIILEREESVIKTGAVIYPHSVHLSDVTIHTFCEEGDKCIFSPTGFCSQYDKVRWNSLSLSFSPRIIAEMLIERLNKVTSLSSNEIKRIRESIYNEETFEENE